MRRCKDGRRKSSVMSTVMASRRGTATWVTVGNGESRAAGQRGQTQDERE
jgi:hypothetical protein